MAKQLRTPRGETQIAALAAEFYVAASLLRLGHRVSLTLGHTKEIDLSAHHADGRTVTIDVKALKNTTNWPLSPKRRDPAHFYVLVCYKHRFKEPHASPEVFVVPSSEIDEILERWSGLPSVTCVNYKRVKDLRYRDAWHLLFAEPRASSRRPR